MKLAGIKTQVATPESMTREQEARFKACDHAACMPTFDAVAARDLPSEEVRKQWPRFQGECPSCGLRMITYASYEHYIMGDW